LKQIYRYVWVGIFSVLVHNFVSFPNTGNSAAHFLFSTRYSFKYYVCFVCSTTCSAFTDFPLYSDKLFMLCTGFCAKSRI